MSNNGIMRFHVLGFGIALGITWAIYVFILGLLASYFNWGNEAVIWLGAIYIGYEPTILGSLIGSLWAIADGFVCGVIIAWLYNWISRYCMRYSNKS